MVDQNGLWLIKMDDGCSKQCLVHQSESESGAWENSENNHGKRVINLRQYLCDLGGPLDKRNQRLTVDLLLSISDHFCQMLQCILI